MHCRMQIQHVRYNKLYRAPVQYTLGSSDGCEMPVVVYVIRNHMACCGQYQSEANNNELLMTLVDLNK